MVRNPVGPFDSVRRKGSHSLPHQSAFAGYSLGLMGVIFGSMQFQKRSWWAVFVAGDTDILEPTAQQFLIADTGLVRHDSQLQGQPAFDGRVSTLVEDLLEIAVGQAIH